MEPLHDDPPRIVISGTRGYYYTGRVDRYGGQHNQGGYFHRKRDARAHALALAADYGLPVVDETGG